VHVIQRERESRTQPHRLRNAGKLIGILMVLLGGGDLRVQDEARKLAASASARTRGRGKATLAEVRERKRERERRHGRA
jgi:hypothetical protein